MHRAFIRVGAIAGQYLVSAVRAQAGGDVRWLVSGSTDRAAAFAKTHSNAQAMAATKAAKARPAGSGRDRLKSLQITRAVRATALSGQDQTVTYGEPQ